MNPSDDFQRKIDSLLAVQAHHNERIQALIRVAELQQERLDHVDDTVANIAKALEEEHTERVERQREVAQQQQQLARQFAKQQQEFAERQKYLDERVDRLVSAIGELARRQ